MAVKTYTYVNGATADGGQVETDLNQIFTNIDNSNINASAAIALTKLASPAWTSYTPTWTAVTTNPVIGNGTITGAYNKIGRLVTGYITVTMGGTTTYGSGQYNLSLPLTISTTNFGFIGIVQILDSSDSNALYTANIGYDGYMSIGNPSVAYAKHVGFSSTVPITLASGDSIRVNFAYESAS